MNFKLTRTLTKEYNGNRIHYTVYRLSEKGYYEWLASGFTTFVEAQTFAKNYKAEFKEEIIEI